MTSFGLIIQSFHAIDCGRGTRWLPGTRARQRFGFYGCRSETARLRSRASDGVFAPFARPNSHGFLDGYHEDLAVPDATGFRTLLDGVDLNPRAERARPRAVAAGV